MISDKMIGKLMYKGIFAGTWDNEYYFVDPSPFYYNGSTLLDRNELSNIIVHSIIPSKQDLLRLYSTKELFNRNCQEEEKWVDEDYWSTSTTFDRGLVVNFLDGVAYSVANNYKTLVRGITKIPVFKDLDSLTH